MTRTMILVSTPVRVGLVESIEAGEAPARDYLELRDILGAELMTPPSQPGGLYRLFSKLGGNALAMAVAAWVRRNDYDVVLTDQEAAGLLLALFFKATRTKRAHVMISHYLTPAKKQALYKYLRVQTHIDCTVCYSTAQEKVAREQLGLTSDQVRMILHPADSNFWRPADSQQESRNDEELLHRVGVHLPGTARVVCSAGLEFRDYATLMKAAPQLPPGTHIVIAASSPWSKRQNTAENVPIPPNVHVVSLKPTELRALYRRAQVVAVPLFDVDFQAGSLVTYEAMACGKPVVITRTKGQSDIVREGETGFYVAPGDAAAMATALNRLLKEREMAAEFGRKAQSVVQEGMNLQTYLTQMAGLVAEVASRHEHPAAGLLNTPVLGRG